MLLASEVLSYWAAINMEEAAGCRSVSARVKSPSEEEFFSVLPVMSHSRTPG